MLIDSHCHLNDDKLKDHINEVLLNAKQVGVEYMLSACSNIYEFDEIIKIANSHNNIFASIAEHPFELQDNLAINDMIDYMSKNITDNREKILCIGECGLDYFYNPDDKEKKKQMDFFDAQLNVALSFSLPVMIHTRNASDDTYVLLKNFVQKGGRGVIHCFTGNDIDAKRYLDLGFYISASGIITFKNSEDLRSVFFNVPMDRLFIETDSPYLSPVPLRGKVNEPAFVKYVAEKLAEIKKVTVEEIGKITSKNFQTLYKVTL